MFLPPMRRDARRRLPAGVPLIALLVVGVVARLGAQASGSDISNATTEQLVQMGLESALRNDFASAAAMLEEALERSPRDRDIAIELATVLSEIGRTSQARSFLTAVIRDSDTIHQQRRAARIRARTFLLDGAPEVALAHARALASGDNRAVVTAQDIFLLYEASVAVGDSDAAEAATTRMERLYPRSPEYQLLVSRARYLPTPSRIFGSMSSIPEPPEESGQEREPDSSEPNSDEPARTPRAVQTGSFRDRENAEYMAQDLERFGFEARIETTAAGLFRVVVPLASPEDSQETVIRLKDRGLQGFLLFDAGE